MRVIERNYRKNPHTANFLMKFHTGGAGLPADLLDEVPEIESADLRTRSQADLMNRLVSEISGYDVQTGASAAEYTQRMTENGRWITGREGNISVWITSMIRKANELRAAAKAPAARIEIEDGIYLLGERVIKVVHAVHGSGRQYGKELVAPAAEGENGTWDRVPGIVAQLTPAMKMTLAEAEKFGSIYGCCVRCARVLTKETSIAQSMGDICAGKF